MNINKKFNNEVNQLSYYKVFEFWGMHFMKCDDYKLTKREAVADLTNVFIERHEEGRTQAAFKMLEELADLQMKEED